MKERPILFNGEMVRAILDGRKTQTRRPVKPQPQPIPEDVWKDKRVPSERQFWWPSKEAGQMVELRDMASLAPLGTVGDRLWVRETWRRACSHPEDNTACIAYAAEQVPQTGGLLVANMPLPTSVPMWHAEDKVWLPSIHMPRWASRIDLEITRVWVERVQDITEEDAKKEGVTPSSFRIRDNFRPFRSEFRDLWQSIYGTWDANPWVWAYEFRRIKP